MSEQIEDFGWSAHLISTPNEYLVTMTGNYKGRGVKAKTLVDRSINMDELHEIEPYLKAHLLRVARGEDERTRAIL